MEQPLLSICIPTYNRPANLAETLQSITAQLSTPLLREQVEIVVTDDGGSELTFSAVQPFQKDYNVQYSKNNPRLRFDLNVARGVELARGQYCWYMGDDDCLGKGVLAFLIDYIIRNHPATITVLNQPYTNISDIIHNPLPLSEEMITHVESPERAYMEGYLDGALSSYIFLRVPWLTCFDRKHFAKEWLYFEVVLKMVAASPIKKFANLKYPAVFVGTECVWAENGYELFIFLSWKNVLDRMVEFGFGTEVHKRTARTMPTSLLLMLARAKGHDLPYRWNDYLFMFREFKNYPQTLVAATCLYLAPNFLVKWVRDIKKYIFRNTKSPARSAIPF